MRGGVPVTLSYLMSLAGDRTSLYPTICRSETIPFSFRHIQWVAKGIELENYSTMIRASEVPITRSFYDREWSGDWLEWYDEDRKRHQAEEMLGYIEKSLNSRFKPISGYHPRSAGWRYYLPTENEIPDGTKLVLHFRGYYQFLAIGFWGELRDYPPLGLFCEISLEVYPP